LNHKNKLKIIGTVWWYEMGAFWFNHFYFWKMWGYFLVKIRGCFGQMIFILGKVEEMWKMIEAFRPIAFILTLTFLCALNISWYYENRIMVTSKQNKTRKNCFRYLRLMSPLNAAICTRISYTLWVEWYYVKHNYLTLRSTVKVPWRSLRYATHRLLVMHPHIKYHWPISKHKNVMARTRKYYLKNNCLPLRSNVKVPRRPLWYATHRLMVMHPHAKYNKPIWKDIIKIE
jgi:hypothetical protein